MILGNRTVTRRRYAAGSRGSDGRWTDGASADTSDTRATWRPIRPREMQMLEEGHRSRQPMVLTSPLEYRTEDQHAGISADRVVVDGVTFEVVAVHASQSGLISHYKAICVRLQEAP